MEDKHFDKVFWFISALVFAVLIFDAGVIFIPIPQSGQKYADILVGSLNTGALMGCISYLLGGTPKNKPASATASSDSVSQANTADTININQSPSK